MLLDANALFLIVRSRFPIEPEVARHRPGAVLAVPSSVLGELDRLADARAIGASVARALAERYERVETEVRGDGGVVDAAERCDAWVVTADRGLQRRLTARGITVLHPRDQHRLEVVEGSPPASPRTPRRRTRGKS